MTGTGEATDQWPLEDDELRDIGQALAADGPTGVVRADEAERAPTVARDVPPGQAEATRSWILLFDGRCAAALRTALAVLRRRDATARAVILAATGGAAAAGLLGRLDLAREIAGRGCAVADAAPHRFPWGRAQVGYGLCLALQVTGHVAEAERAAAAGYRAATARDASAMTGLWAALRGVAARAAGRPADARAALAEAVSLLEDNDSYHMAPVHLAELAGAAALAGAPDAAREHQVTSDALRDGANRLFEAWIERDRAWVVAAGGDLTGAVRLMKAAADLARDTEQPTVEATCLYDAARLGAPAAVRTRLAALAPLVKGWYVATLARAAEGLATGDARALERAADRFVEHGHALLAAEILSVAAVLHQHAGRPGGARTLRERAVVLAEACPGARTPLLDQRGLVTVLTRREREVAVLAASLPSRKIADLLGLSVRTVDNHLGRAYMKLGVTGRRELTAILGRVGTERDR